MFGFMTPGWTVGGRYKSMPTTRDRAESNCDTLIPLFDSQVQDCCGLARFEVQFKDVCVVTSRVS